MYKTSETFDLPRKVIDQYQIGKKVSWDKAQPGDLVYFRSLEETKDIPTHVALYAGNHQVIHITLSQGVVKTDVSKKANIGLIDFMRSNDCPAHKKFLMTLL
ncbi:hypothetical protein BsIDN1_63640 [Bacillus safensis]|uniref:NlpC/P60 domain-containing protein n=1 Tax=Bacillus safensis TaxID=561879 RepID=A0A5S9MM60_BACIA|nr:hypothetical protein BsIDN1_63640 [Bacillus safensis]